MSIDDPTTVARAPRRPDPPGVTPTLRGAITILWHRNVRRIGSIGSLPADTEVTISRKSQPFDRAEDVVLSRAPFLSLTQSPRGFELRPCDSRTTVEVDGRLLDSPRFVSEHDVKAGVIISLGHEIVVCLHQIEVPLHRGVTLDMIGNSDAIEHVRRTILAVADLDTPVLIRGETGTGKELVARAIQRMSKRARAPFVRVSLADVPSQTAASAFFGHVRGAFTGATRDQPGYFVQADGGTLFLDELALATTEVQKMLLRVLQTGEVMPLGASRERKVRVRILCATDEKLETAAAQGRFQEPLLHRLSRVQIQLQPLRERRADVGELLLHFLRGELEKVGAPALLALRELKETPWLSADDFARIARDDLRGNVRSLENIASQLVVSNRGKTTATLTKEVEALLSADPASARPSEGQSVSTRRITDDEIQRALERHKFNFTAAAAELGVNRSTLYDRVGKGRDTVRSASKLTDAEVLASHNRHGSNLDAMAGELRVSRKGIAARLRQALARLKRR